MEELVLIYHKVGYYKSVGKSSSYLIISCVPCATNVQYALVQLSVKNLE